MLYIRHFRLGGGFGSSCDHMTRAASDAMGLLGSETAVSCEGTHPSGASSTTACSGDSFARWRMSSLWPCTAHTHAPGSTQPLGPPRTRGETAAA
jgi:hypothetical protein